MRCCTAEVTLAAIMCDSSVQAPCRCLRVVFAVSLCFWLASRDLFGEQSGRTKGLSECVGFVVRLVQVLLLDLGCLFECLTGLLAWKIVSGLERAFKLSIKCSKILCLILPIFCILNALAAAMNWSAAASSSMHVSLNHILMLRCGSYISLAFHRRN